MVNDETLRTKKKKKKKRRPSELAELDDSQINIKKKKKLKDGVKSEDGVKKKKKKKKSLKNSTMILDPPEPVTNREDDPQAVLSDRELFGSQSPSPIKPAVSKQSPPPLTKHSPVKHNDKEHSNSLSDDEPEEEVNSSVIEPKLSPVKKFAKKTKIVNQMLNVEESPKKKFKVGLESDDSGADEEVDEVAPLPVKEEVEAVPWAPLSDPLISQHEQDQCDLVLLGQVRDKFPDTQVKDVNWNDLFVFHLTPDKMAARYDVLLRNIPREKNNGTLVREAMEAFCNAKIREVPLTKRDPMAKIGGSGQSKLLKKKLNAFTLFASSFDQKKVSRDEIKEKWEHLDVQEKKKLKKEARTLNNVHGIQRGEYKGPRTVSAYLLFSKELMNQGFKMTDIGAKWKTLTDVEKKEYQELADETNRERKTSHNEQAQSQ